jgi:PBP1b-binding outer membrane lipoprotein LpoB
MKMKIVLPTILFVVLMSACQEDIAPLAQQEPTDEPQLYDNILKLAENCCYYLG